MSENPNSTALATHVFPGGRPPDDTSPDVSAPVLWHSVTGRNDLDSSPMVLGDVQGVLDPCGDASGEQSLRQSFGRDSDIPEVVMEASVASSDPPGDSPSQVDLQPSTYSLPSKPGTVSYAHMVAKNLRHNGEPKIGGIFAQDKVVVLEEDFVIDRADVLANGTRFSILADSGDHGGRDSNLPALVTAVSDQNSVPVEQVSNRVSLNVAYAASNPGKKKKPMSRAASVPEVITLVEGEVTKVVPHVVKQQPDKYVAVALLDSSTRKSCLVGGKATKQRGLAGRNISDARRGLPLRKSAEFRMTNANNMSTWSRILHNNCWRQRMPSLVAMVFLGLSRNLWSRVVTSQFQILIRV
ncbi:hypothetical protein V6N13_108183 [Hibiscus sabdariffa]|uniref:Uncharacterized protein n=1 Tax=Hibiscus sabdariffa TaxID=183260 RepID=A0ABR2SRK8_9ROSI